MTAHFLVTTTTSTREEAMRLSRLAVEQRHAACAQIAGPITSIYWWEDRLETNDEWVCTFKTSATALAALTAALREAHSYTTPEIVATAIEGGDAAYLAWIDAETSKLD
jgi:periplasmic divalent cation tolerance protein